MSKTAVQWKEAGNYCFAKKDFKAAITCYTTGLGLDPFNSILLSNRAECYLRLGLYHLAAEDADLGTQLDNGNTKCYVRLLKALVGLERFTCARAVFVIMAKKLARSDNAHEFTAEMKKMEDMITPKSLRNSYIMVDEEDEFTKKGNQMKAAGKYEEARIYYTRAIRQNPNNLLLYLNRAEALLHIINCAHLAYWDSLVLLTENIPLCMETKIWKLMAQALCVLKDFSEDTKITLRMAVLLNPDDVSLAKLQTASLSWKSKQFIGSPLGSDTIITVPEKIFYSSEEESIYLHSLFHDCPYFEVKRVPGMGRGVFAKADIKANTSVERPCVVSATIREDMCQDCFKELKNEREGVKCEKCGTERYCSPKCLKNSWVTYHRALCGKDLHLLRENIRNNARSSSGKSPVVIARILGTIMCSPEWEQIISNPEYDGIPTLPRLRFLMSSRKDFEIFMDSVPYQYFAEKLKLIKNRIITLPV